MSFVYLQEQLELASSPFDLARRLGDACLEGGWLLKRFTERPEVGPDLEELEARVERLDPELLEADADSGFAHLMDVPGIRAAVERLEGFNPIEHLGFLRGLIRHLRPLYDDFEGVLEVSSGSLIPIAERGINQHFRPSPRIETCGINDLLHGSSFYLFEFGASKSVPVELDFRFRDRLDEVTWSAAKRLPKIATVHPRVGKDGILVEERDPGGFFGVRPRNFEVEAVLDQLRALPPDVSIAVLPELSLPQADALEDALAAAPDSYPPIVVAGSAHLRETATESVDGLEVRANECRIYLDGSRVGAHRKIHPYEMRRTPEGGKVEEPMTERLTKERKPLTVLAGRFTRLAVVICADALDNHLHAPLADAQVNLLLVPALTPESGGFSGTIGALASRCQGVSVIANVDTAFFSGAEDPPFAVIVSVPRGKMAEQGREFHSPGPFPAATVIDPNESLDQALEWHETAPPLNKKSQIGEK